MNRLYGLTTRDKDAVQRLLRSAQRQTKPHQHRRNPRLLMPGGADIRIFKVQSEAAGDGIYNCREQTLDATEWTDTAGDPKFDDKNTTEVEVLNLAEFDPEASYTAMLSAGDMMAAWRMTDDEGNKRWVGIPLASTTSGEVRKAYCKTDAGAATTIVAYLDTDGTGTEVTVNCSIAGGGNLNSALPFLTDGLRIMVTKIGGEWFCNAVFQHWDIC